MWFAGKGDLRLLLTYLLPVAPLMVLWDGLVSCLRSYTVGELRALIERIPGADGYDWTIDVARGNRAAPVTYVLGVPRRATKPSDG